MKIWYLLIGLSIIVLSVIFTFLSWTTCEPCELKIVPTITNMAFIIIALIFIGFGLKKEKEVEEQPNENLQELPGSNK